MDRLGPRVLGTTQGDTPLPVWQVGEPAPRGFRNHSRLHSQQVAGLPLAVRRDKSHPSLTSVLNQKSHVFVASSGSEIMETLGGGERLL